MDNFFFGFADEMVKLSIDLSGDTIVGATGGASHAIGEAIKKDRGKLTAVAGALGIPVGSLLGLLMGGKGRRLRGMGIGALGGGAVGAAHGARLPEEIQRLGKGMMEAAEKKASERAFSDLGMKEIKRQTASGALTMGGLAALIAALASKKGHKLKRALAGGAAGGAIGSLSGAGEIARQFSKMQGQAYRGE